MPQRALGHDHAAAALAVAEDAIDRLQQRHHGAERQPQRHTAPFASGSAACLGEALAGGREHLRRRALEAVDRLLLVADAEKCPLLVGGAGANEEFRCQRLDDRPLLRARVLRLVDQNVIEAAVELEQHPGGGVGRGKQPGGAANEIIEVERRPLRLGIGEALQHVAGKAQQRQRRLEQRQGAALAVELKEALRRAIDHGDEIGIGCRQLLRHQVLARAALAGEQEQCQRIDA